MTGAQRRSSRGSREAREPGIHAATNSVRSLPLQGGGLGWGSQESMWMWESCSTEELTPTRAFGATSPLQGEVEPAARAQIAQTTPLC